MTTEKPKVSRAFGDTEATLTETIQAVITNLYGKAAYPSPPVPKEQMEAANAALLQAIGD